MVLDAGLAGLGQLALQVFEVCRQRCCPPALASGRVRPALADSSKTGEVGLAPAWGSIPMGLCSCLANADGSGRSLWQLRPAVCHGLQTGRSTAPSNCTLHPLPERSMQRAIPRSAILLLSLCLRGGRESAVGVPARSPPISIGDLSGLLPCSRLAE
jgi:hypothetical protein